MSLLLSAIVILSLIMHPLLLRVAVQIMVNVRLAYKSALIIIAIEYGIATLVGGMIMLLLGDVSLILGGLIVFLSVVMGTFYMSEIVKFTEREKIGIGNAVLIQFMQIPLIIPLVILASFIFDALPIS